MDVARRAGPVASAALSALHARPWLTARARTVIKSAMASSSTAGKRGPEDDDLFTRAEAQESARILTVAELTRGSAAASRASGACASRARSRAAPGRSGHVYFDLKDIDAKIACTIWKSQVRAAVRFDLAGGRAGRRARHASTCTAPRGTYSLNVQRLEPAGLGALLVQLEELKAELKAAAGSTASAPLPAMPRVIGVVTSRDGAALQDFLRTRSLRWPLYPVRPRAHARAGRRRGARDRGRDRAPRRAAAST